MQPLKLVIKTEVFTSTAITTYTQTYTHHVVSICYLSTIYSIVLTVIPNPLVMLRGRTLNTHTDFLKFEAVLQYCEARVPKDSTFGALDYGRELQLFGHYNSLSSAGNRLAERLMSTNEVYPAVASGGQ